MRIHVTHLHVDDQSKAKQFYTETLGFVLKHDVSAEDHRWLTVVSRDDLDGPLLLLEPSDHPAVQPYKAALYADGIPATSFQVDDLDAEYRRLRAKNVEFLLEPVDNGPSSRAALFDDTCGNLVQLVQTKRQNPSKQPE